MDYSLIFVIFIIMVCMFVIAVVTWLCHNNPNHIISLWNYCIKGECDKQDLYTINGIPSYQNAWECSNKIAKEFHQLIHINHNQILSEVSDAMKYYNKTSDEDNWNPIWIRFMGEWNGSSERLPMLKQIALLFPEVSNLYVSIFYPGTTLIEQKNTSRIFHRYHYGLKIPTDDVGLKIDGYNVKWKEREGYIWDDTLSHSAWNHTSEPRIVIFADIFRDLSVVNTIGSKFVYSLLKRNMYVKNHIQQETIMIN